MVESFMTNQSMWGFPFYVPFPQLLWFKGNLQFARQHALAFAGSILIRMFVNVDMSHV